MHVVVIPREEAITVKFAGKLYTVTLDQNGAFVPANLGEHMVTTGLVARGTLNDPPPEWARIAGGGHGALIDKYARYVKEIT